MGIEVKECLGLSKEGDHRDFQYAVAELKLWHSQNSDVQIISVETVNNAYSTFQCVRVWFTKRTE